MSLGLTAEDDEFEERQDTWRRWRHHERPHNPRKSSSLIAVLRAS
jgi:hypothetical protein